MCIRDSLDTSLRGLGEERPAFPGLTLPAARSFLPGAAQGQDSLDPSLGLQIGVGSCPQAVDLAHPDASVGAIGTDHSAQIWGESRPLVEQERSTQYTTTTATTQNNLSYTNNQDTTKVPELYGTLQWTWNFMELFTNFKFCIVR